MRSFCRKNHVHKIPRFRGGGGILGFGGGGGGSADFIFMGARIFLNLILITFKQVIQRKHARISWPQEGAQNNTQLSAISR